MTAITELSVPQIFTNVLPVQCVMLRMMPYSAGNNQTWKDRFLALEKTGTSNCMIALHGYDQVGQNIMYCFNINFFVYNADDVRS